MIKKLRAFIGKTQEGYMKMKKSKVTVFIAAAVATAAFTFFGTDNIFAKSQKTQTINDGVYIGSVDVGGMTKNEAKTALSDYIESIDNTTFTLQGANGSVDATAAEMSIKSDASAAVDEAMGVGRTGNLINRFVQSKKLENGEVSVNMHLSVDKEKTAQFLYDNKDKLDVEAVDSGLEKTADGFNYIEGTQGQEVDIVSSVYAINDFLENKWDGKSNEIDLVSTTIEPRGTKEELSKIKDVLGTFSTDFSTSKAGRAANVKNACSLINGHIVYPGEQFSVYSAISPITEDNGYELAGAYENGQVVESVGGGVCQVSTTLYNAIIRAELEVVQRFNHSMIVSYVDPSDDAAIAGTYKDFKFKNNLDNPIYIEGYCSGGIITFNVYGVEMRKEGREVSFHSETVSETEPEIQFNFDGSQPVGYYSVDQSPHKGIVARLWKTVKENGEVVSDEVFNNSNYKASPKIVTVGTAGASEEVLAAMQAAAGSQDESTVRSLGTDAAAALEAAQNAAADGTTADPAQAADQTTAPAQTTTPDQSQTQTPAQTTTPDQSQTQAPAQTTTPDQSQTQAPAQTTTPDQSQTQAPAQTTTPDQSQTQTTPDQTQITPEQGATDQTSAPAQ